MRPDVPEPGRKAEQLIARMRSYGPVAVALSGGVDSAVVARAAVEVWGNEAVAVTAVSPSLAESERVAARQTAAQIGIRHVELSTAEFERHEYRRNAGDRCYFCKDTLYSLATSQLTTLGVTALVNGANTDDTGDHRPGMIAARDHGVRSPLLEEGLSKSDVRQLARYWNLDVAEKPASPCLSSRIAYGVEVTAERVARVEHAEAFIRQVTGLADLRVRLEAGELARIEVPLDEVPRLLVGELRMQIAGELRRLGFRCVTVDLDGLRSGSLNALLPMIELGDHSS